MPDPVNPITNPLAVGVDRNMEPERRVQSLFHAWLGLYFTGLPFDTRALGGGVEQKTFEDCRVQWQEAGVPDPENGNGVRAPQDKPIIHGVLLEPRRRRNDDSAEEESDDLDWTMQFMVKVPHNLMDTDQSSDVDPKFVVRRVADQLAWLLRSAERAGLAAHGVQNVDLRSGPSLLTSGVWVVRLLVVTCRTRRSSPHL